jgi:flagellar basal-body rod protein FlgF/flagellar basal-body rod protein FlgG
LDLGTASALPSAVIGTSRGLGEQPAGRTERPGDRRFADAKGRVPMENALLVGLSRQMALMHQLDIVANNIANINTTGFKTDNALFGEYLMPRASDQSFSGRDRRIDFVQDRASWIDMSSGSIERTGNPLDVAVEGNAFFVVQNAQGQQRYTRNGAFSISATGQLVNSEGDQVIGAAGPITFQQGDQDVMISDSGIVTVRQGNGTADTPRGTLQLVTIDQPQRLQKDGGSSFIAPTGVNANPAPAGTRVVQGAIEKSNVNGVAEMARLIQLTRSYTDIANILQQQSDQRRNALSQLSQPPASS